MTGARFVDQFMCRNCGRTWPRRARCCGQAWMVPCVVMEADY